MAKIANNDQNNEKSVNENDKLTDSQEPPRRRKRRNKKMTPFRAMEILCKVGNTSKKSSAGYDFLELCKMKTDHKTSSNEIIQGIEKAIKENPWIIIYVDPTNGYNALHYVCSNPSLVNHLNVIKILIEASVRWFKRNDGAIANLLKKSSMGSVLLRHKSQNNELPLHLLCKNASMATLDVFEYLVLTYPDSVRCKDNRNNLPLHYICKECTEEPVSLEFVLLLIQQWPKSYEVRNQDGNLPLHLASEIMKPASLIVKSISESHFSIQEKETKSDCSDTVDMSRSNADDSYGCGGREDFLRCEIDEIDDSSVTNHEDEYEENESFHAIYRDSAPKVAVKHKEKQEFETYERSRYQKQLEILQYLVDVYPKGLTIRNKVGHTPLDIAKSSISDSCFGETNKRWVANNFLSKSLPIVEFLDRDKTSSTCCDASLDNLSIISKHTKTHYSEDMHQSGIIDTSGQEYDDEEFESNPWIEEFTLPEEIVTEDKSLGLTTSNHQRESVSICTSRRSLLSTEDRLLGLKSSSYQRESMARSTASCARSDGQSQLSSSSYHNNNRSHRSIHSVDTDEDDNITFAMQALEEFSENNDSLVGSPVPAIWFNRRRMLGKQKENASIASLRSFSDNLSESSSGSEDEDLLVLLSSGSLGLDDTSSSGSEEEIDMLSYSELLEAYDKQTAQIDTRSNRMSLRSGLLLTFDRITI